MLTSTKMWRLNESVRVDKLRKEIREEAAQIAREEAATGKHTSDMTRMAEMEKRAKTTKRTKIAKRTKMAKVPDDRFDRVVERSVGSRTPRGSDATTVRQEN